MATHDYVIDNSTGANVRADINSVLQAILTNNSSSSAPSTTAAYMWWADTTNGVLKIRNSSDNAWVELLQLDGTLTLEDGSASTPALSFRDDLNTGVYSSAADTFNVATGGVERMELGATTIFNEDGADVDFRIEGDTDTDLFYVDAGNDRVAIGNSTPATKLDVSRLSSAWAGAAPVAGTTIFAHSGTTSASSPSYLSISAGNTSISGINLGDSDDADVGQIKYNHSDNSLDFRVNASTRLTIKNSGELQVGSIPTDADRGAMSIKSAADAQSVPIAIYMQESSGNEGYGVGVDSNGDLNIYNGESTTTTVEILDNNNVVITDGDLGIGTAGHGIDFSAQTATSASGATASAELLNHYEEGTFTPFCPSLTATNLQGHYTRVGRVVHCSIFITIPSNSNGNAFVIDGLPFNTFNPDPSVGASLQGGYVIYSNYSAAVLVRTNQGGDRVVVNTIGGSNITLTTLDNIEFRIGLHYFTT